MAQMTDEEAKRLDEKWTKTPPKPGPKGTGYFTQCKKTAEMAADDYRNDKELTAFTVLDGEDFF